MTNNDWITKRCEYCNRAFTVPRNENDQYDHEFNGFCSYTCESKMYDSWNHFDRYGKP